MFFKTAISVGPIPPILYFTDQVWAGAVLGRFVGALRWVQDTCFILGALLGLIKAVAGSFPYYFKARGLFSAKRRGAGVIWMHLISHYDSGISLASSFSLFLLQALRQFLPLVFRMAMMCISQVWLGRGICKFFQKGTHVYWRWCDGMQPKEMHVRVQEFTAEQCVGIRGHPYILGGKEHEGSCCLSATGSRVNCTPCC